MDVKSICIRFLLLSCVWACNVQARYQQITVLIGLDGVYVPTLKKMLDLGKLPSLRSIQQTGAWTLEAKTLSPTCSYRVWAACLYGTLPTALGNIFFDDIFYNEDIKTSKKIIYPQQANIFTAIKPASSAIIGNWPDLVDYVCRHKSGKIVDYDVDLYDMRNLEPENKQFKQIKQQYLLQPNKMWDWDETVLERALNIVMKREHKFIFIYLLSVDNQGHLSGVNHMYEKQLQKADLRIGKIMAALKKTDIIAVVSDHGRDPVGQQNNIEGQEHDLFTASTMTIPFFIKGPKIKPMKLNADISIIDVASTIINLMGYRVPKEMRGKILALS